ncbi:MAG: cytochrome P460 family protein [Candidatus Thiodiazotropha sp. (ex Lucinoma borealis)]|nr:cytochrome P460 family protein [Candidatus Thiodiazotropha sp. (ex Lucinoma borealis)]
MFNSNKLPLAFILGLALTAPIGASSTETFSPYVDTEGNISLPQDFRLRMVHLGSWFVPEGDASGFHDVYTEAESATAYRATGKFPDGATLVKELRASDSADYTTGKGVHSASTRIKQWFVMVKDAKGRFTGNLTWGDGWGWALFKTDAPDVNVSKDYQADCLSCHIPAQETDLVYIHAYPTLSGDR